MFCLSEFEYERCSLTVGLWPFSPGDLNQEVDVLAWNRFLCKLEFDEADFTAECISVTFPRVQVKRFNKNAVILISFVINKPVSPASMSINQDLRKLGYGMRSIRAGLEYFQNEF